MSKLLYKFKKNIIIRIEELCVATNLVCSWLFLKTFKAFDILPTVCLKFVHMRYGVTTRGVSMGRESVYKKLLRR